LVNLCLLVASSLNLGEVPPLSLLLKQKTCP
jgi:hypothetical protein